MPFFNIFIPMLFFIIPFIDWLIDNIGYLTIRLVKIIFRFVIYYIMCIMYILWVVFTLNIFINLINLWYYHNDVKMNLYDNYHDNLLFEHYNLLKYININMNRTYE